MELNNIQKKIYLSYIQDGKVWAECPRNSGKSSLLLYIARCEISNNKLVFYKSISHKSFDKFIKQLNEFQRGFITVNECEADIILYDEIYYDGRLRNSNKKVVCLMTKTHPTIQFNYLDLDREDIKQALQIKQKIPEEQWNLEYNNGGKEHEL